MVATKIVDGQVRERRIRRPKNAALTDSLDIIPVPDDESIFDDEWRERRYRAPAGDLVMDFRMKKAMVNITTLAVEDLVKRRGAVISDSWMEEFRSLVTPSFVVLELAGFVMKKLMLPTRFGPARWSPSVPS
ncbi:hypothetical protein N7493_009798 [Penicillium malachiteum]|uniref:Uncharacterized protein n=1 Tax=Penicillium malachiteum TaxID=1324776 RepID=A0AAD6HEY9_9EURO|nr:hypothetical protein N7493_009798 [Penicillium malachiteum]